ncbi:hypothetical protein DFH09DRAFT_1080533 [Mycena vulgaris]|nr:hypothetical protein DFH09DRAFT_1080533 [Mycena vulgaris]
MAPATITTTTQILLEPPEALFDEYGNVLPVNSEKEANKRAVDPMDIERPRVVSVDTTDGHELDFGDQDDEMEDDEIDTLPSGSTSPTEDGTDDPHSSFLKYENPQVSKTDPMRGGGIVLESISTKEGRMCAHRPVHAMALEGADAEDERKLLRRIKDKKWTLNENLYVPECRGEQFDPKMDPDELDGLKCDICEEYARHVGEDFARGEGSLKAVLQLRELYLLADARIDNRQAEKSIRLLEVANSLAEQLNEDKDRQVEAAKAEKSLAVQEIGRLGAKLEESERKLDNTWDEIKELEDKITELDALVENLAFPELPHKKARRRDEDAPRKTGTHAPPAAVRNSEDVVMGEAESVTTKEPLAMDQGPSSLPTPVALADRLTGPPRDEAKSAGKPALSLLANVVVLAPPMLETEPNVDERGFPTDVATVDAVVKLLNTGKPYYVYALRMFYLFTFCRAIPTAARTPAQQRAINTFIMFDWFANLLTTGIDGYDAWTLNMHHVRGLNLLEALTIRRSIAKPDEQTRNYRAQLEKAFIEIFCKPTLYRQLLEQQRLTPNTTFVARHWLADTDGDPTHNNVARFFANCGVSQFMIDDTFEFGQQWIFDWTEKNATPPGWTPEELAAAQHQASWGKPPRGLFPPINDVFPRRPDLPWVHHADQFVLTQLSEWQHPELVGMIRAPGSKIQSVINRGISRPISRNEHKVEQINPFRRDERRRVNDSATAHLAQTGAAVPSRGNVPATLANRRTSGLPRGVRMQQRADDAVRTSLCPAAPSVGDSTHVAPLEKTSLAGMQVTFHDPHPASYTANLETLGDFADALAQAGITDVTPFRYGETEYDANVVMDGWTAPHIS